MRALWLLPLALAACDAAPVPAPDPAAPDAPIPVTHQSFAPAPQPLSEEVLASLPADVALSDVFIAADGCYFFLQGADLLLLTLGDSQTPYCP